MGNMDLTRVIYIQVKYEQTNAATLNGTLHKVCENIVDVHIVGGEQERSISARRIRTSYFGSARKNVLSPLGA